MEKKDLEMIMNAKTLPVVYYGLHMVEGVAEYREKAEPYRILILENALKEMDATFIGRPVYVEHVDEVKLDRLELEADGYVVESFFNKADGKHWAKFIVVSDRGHEAIRKGWRLSNAYTLRQTGAGGQWHGVDYLKEVTKGEYDHLAIVPDPRYDESIILTPDEFKEYNAKKEAELLKLANSNDNKGDTIMFFTKEKVKNSADLEKMSVELPKSKKTVELMKIINAADEMEMNSDKPVYANGDHKIKINESEEMSVNELVEKYNSICSKKNEDDDADEALEAEKKKNAEEEEKKKNEAAAEEEKKKNEAKKAEDEKAKNAKDAEKAAKTAEFEALKNAREAAELDKLKNSATLETSDIMVERGRSRYGSN